MNDPMIVFDRVTKHYCGKTAIENLSFEVARGEFFGYLGPNGAGKTTSIKSLIGLVHPDNGTILVDGIDVGTNPLGVRQIIGYVPDSPFIYEKLTGREFMHFVAGLYRMDPVETGRRIDWLVDIFSMADWLDTRCGEYSHGMKQKVVMAAAFLHKPKLLIVDEPTVGLDPPSKRLLRDMLKLMQSQGMTIFMSSHDLNEVEELCERMVILHRGYIAAQGTLDELRTQTREIGGGLESLFLKLTGLKEKTAYLE